MNSRIDVSASLEELRDDYTYRVNVLLEEGREDLAMELADRYPEDEARTLQGCCA